MSHLSQSISSLIALVLWLTCSSNIFAQEHISPEEEAFLKAEAKYIARQFTDALTQLGRADVSETESKLYRMKIREMFSDDAFVDDDLLTMQRGTKVTVDDYLSQVKTSFASNGVKLQFSDFKTIGIFKGQYYFAVVTLQRQIKGISSVDSSYIANRVPRDIIVKFDKQDSLWTNELKTYQYHEGINQYKQAKVQEAANSEEAEATEQIILNTKIREYDQLNSQLHEIQKDLLKRYREIESEKPSDKLSARSNHSNAKTNAGQNQNADHDHMLMQDINSHNMYHGKAILKFAPVRLLEGLAQLGFEHRIGQRSSIELNAGWYLAIPNLLYHEPLVLIDTMDTSAETFLTELKNLHDSFDYSSLDNFTQKNGLGWNLRGEMRFYQRTDMQGRYIAPRIMYKSTSWENDERVDVSNQVLALDLLLGWQWHHRKRLHDDFYIGWGVRYINFDNGDINIAKPFYANFNIGYKVGLRFKTKEGLKEEDVLEE